MPVLSDAQIASIANKYVGQYGPGMVALMTMAAKRESGGNTSIIGDNYKSGHQSATSKARYDYGLWQINSQHPYDPTQLIRDVEYNAQAMANILATSGIGAWSTMGGILDDLGLDRSLMNMDLWSVADAVGQALGYVAEGAGYVKGLFDRSSGQQVDPEELANTLAPPNAIKDPNAVPTSVRESFATLQAQGYSFLSYAPSIHAGGGGIQIGGKLQLLDPMGRLVTFNVSSNGVLDPTSATVQDIGLSVPQTGGRLVPVTGGNYLDPGTSILYAPDGTILSDPNGVLAQQGLDIQWYNAQTARNRAEVDAMLGIQGLNYNYARLDLDRELGFDTNAIARERLALDERLGMLEHEVAAGRLSLDQWRAEQETRLAQQAENRLGFTEPASIGVSAFNAQTNRDLGRAGLFSDAFANETSRMNQETQALTAGGGLMSDLAATIARMGSDPGSAVEKEFLTRALLPPGTPQSIPISGMIQDIITKLTDLERFAGTRDPYEAYDTFPQGNVNDSISQLLAMYQQSMANAPQAPTYTPPASTPTPTPTNGGAGQTTQPNLAEIAAQFAATSGTRNRFATPTPAEYKSPAQQAREAAAAAASTSKVSPSAPAQIQAPAVTAAVSSAYNTLINALKGPSASNTKSGSAIAPKTSASNYLPSVQASYNDFMRMYEDGGSTREPIMMVGDSSDDEPNEEILLNPTNAPLQIIPVDILSKLLEKWREGGAGDKVKSKSRRSRRHKVDLQGVPKYEFGTLSGVLSGTSPHVQQSQQGNLSTTPDEQWQQLPALQLLQGVMDSTKFGRLAKGNLTGAFGTRVPLSGMLNIGSVIQAEQAGATPILSAIYKSAGLDYAQEVNRALQRAPIGRAVTTSTIAS